MAINVVIIQARMGSNRLPGKVLMKHQGKTMLETLIDRLKVAKKVDQFIIATSTSTQDSAIANLCEKRGWSFFRGSEEDCLDRYYQAGIAFGLKGQDTVIRLTADCPLLDSLLLDTMISDFLTQPCDYLANNIPPDTRMYPDGSDIEIMTFDSLTKVWTHAIDPKDREHVTFYYWKYDHPFKIRQFPGKNDLSNFRYTLDYSEDFTVITYVLDILRDMKREGTVEDICSIINRDETIKKLNQHHFFGEGWQQNNKAGAS